jgi:hypothetical protein
MSSATLQSSGNGSGLNFALVGEGSDARIFAFASLSSLTVAGESQKTENSGWICTRCSYENADKWNRVCSVCGCGKDGAEAKPRKTVRYQFAKEVSLSVESLMEAADDIVPSTTRIAKGQVDSKVEKELMMSYANWSLCDQGGWTCLSCTFLNQNSLHLTCEVCQQVRPPKESSAQPFSQRSFQEFMNESLAKLGQEDYLQKQRERILQLEERALEEERMKEIAEIQRELFAKIAEEREKVFNTTQEAKKVDEENEAQTEAPPSSERDRESKEIVSHCLDEIDEAKRILERTHERIKRLESIRQQQAEEQTKMKELLEQQMEMLKKARESTDRPNGVMSAEYNAQQKMLEFWREEFVTREKRMVEIRVQQDLLLRQLQEKQEQQ